MANRPSPVYINKKAHLNFGFVKRGSLHTVGLRAKGGGGGEVPGLNWFPPFAQWPKLY